MVSFLGGKQVYSLFISTALNCYGFGVTGLGKTTSIAKIAHLIQSQAQQKGKKRRILLASIDFYRPAAVDQLEQMARNAQVDFYRAPSTDPLKAVRENLSPLQASGYELLFLDTAGRFT